MRACPALVSVLLLFLLVPMLWMLGDFLRVQSARQEHLLVSTDLMHASVLNQSLTTTPIVEPGSFRVDETNLGWCHMLRNIEYGGTVIKRILLVKREEDCCRACQELHEPGVDRIACNAWTWCGIGSLCGSMHLHCVLKFVQDIKSPDILSAGSPVGWSSGVVSRIREHSSNSTEMEREKPDRKFHTIITSSGFGNQWLTRIAYYHYTKIKKKNPNGDMGGFTRILHSGHPDELMDEIPTFVAAPLPQGLDQGYIVLNRPYAIQQWVKKQLPKIPEQYVLMCEPDHLIASPIPNFMEKNTPAAYPFWYIQPLKHKHLVRQIAGDVPDKDFDQIYGIGSSPVIIQKTDLARVVEKWVNISIAIKNNKEADQAWGWVQEMYGWSIASYVAGLRKYVLVKEMMVQPPFDSKLGNTPIIHLTYAMRYASDGNMIREGPAAWKFDKRDYLSKPPPCNLSFPPAGTQNEVVWKMIDLINEATASIPGWSEYAANSEDQCCSKNI